MGTGLSSHWVKGVLPSDYEELDRALMLLTPASFALDGVGPVSLSNNLAPIGDFSTHAPMPYSTMGIPENDGWYLATRMSGAWAGRAPGTYTFAIGSDDGYRVTVAGVVLLEHAPSQPFRHEAAAFVVRQGGLYPIVVEYFNGVEEGAIELSFAPGDVSLAGGVSAPVPAAFQLVPLADLYPPEALGESGADDAGAPSSPEDAGESSSPDDGGALDDASLGTPGDGAAGPVATATGASSGGPLDGEQWHGGGCSAGATEGSSSAWRDCGLAFLLVVVARSRRARVSGRGSANRS
jgi:hypothetical protein